LTQHQFQILFSLRHKKLVSEMNLKVGSYCLCLFQWWPV